MVQLIFFFDFLSNEEYTNLDESDDDESEDFIENDVQEKPKANLQQ